MREQMKNGGDTGMGGNSSIILDLSRINLDCDTPVVCDLGLFAQTFRCCIKSIDKGVASQLVERAKELAQSSPWAAFSYQTVAKKRNGCSSCQLSTTLVPENGDGFSSKNQSRTEKSLASAFSVDLDSSKQLFAENRLLSVMLLTTGICRRGEEAKGPFISFSRKDAGLLIGAIADADYRGCNCVDAAQKDVDGKTIWTMRVCKTENGNGTEFPEDLVLFGNSRKALQMPTL